MDAPDTIVDQLAYDYRQGVRSALAGLGDALSTTVDVAVSQVIRDGLPPLLTPEDLRQEVWTILARLALRWRPADARFVACVRGSLRWELEHVVARASGDRSSWRQRRRRRAWLISLSQPLVLRQADHRVRADWTDAVVDRLFAEHVLSVLTPPQARDVRLVAFRDFSAAGAARHTGIRPKNVRKNLQAARRRVAPFFDRSA